MAAAGRPDRADAELGVMNTSSPWMRFFAGIVAAAVAIRVAVELIAPVLPYVVGAIAIYGIVVLARWWRDNRW